MHIVNKRAFITMARMVCFPKTHIGADFEETEGYRSMVRETMWELLDAQYMVELILRHNGIKIVPLKTSKKGWNMPEVKGLWYDPGEETIEVPRLCDRYLA